MLIGMQRKEEGSFLLHDKQKKDQKQFIASVNQLPNG